MDKYKTSEVGRALKKVFHGEMTVDESVKLAENEIAGYFGKNELPPELDTDTGFFGDVVGKCPKCGRDVVRYRYKYSCSGYKEGCDFGVGCYICSRAISVYNMKMLLETGRTSKIQGFVSRKTGKTFDGFLVLKDGKAQFEF